MYQGAMSFVRGSAFVYLKWVDEIMALIIDLNQRHKQTFVIVTHAPDVAARCHRIIHMKDGQIVREEIPQGAHS